MSGRTSLRFMGLDEPETLSVFLIEDGERHWYAARDADDAWALFNDPHVASMNEDGLSRDEVKITQLADRHTLTIRDDDGRRISWFARELTALYGRGFICSTVF